MDQLRICDRFQVLNEGGVRWLSNDLKVFLRARISKNIWQSESIHSNLRAFPAEEENDNVWRLLRSTPGRRTKHSTVCNDFRIGSGENSIEVLLCLPFLQGEDENLRGRCGNGSLGAVIEIDVVQLMLSVDSWLEAKDLWVPRTVDQCFMVLQCLPDCDR